MEILRNDVKDFKKSTDNGQQTTDFVQLSSQTGFVLN